uniref:BPTI/Kunitz inhibitor domain-containing protein n=1 Tax=Globodera rostochiensis TaxID=31243 RepID=A0A914HJ93_GLORO
MEKGPGLLVRYATADRPSPVLLRQLPLILSFLCFSSAVIADLPQELDPFLERLFETVECEAFLADSSFLAVSTRDCPPTTCDFPRLLCMRPSASYKDERANQCRAIPEECLIAANGGQPPQSPAHSTRPPTAAPQPRPADLVTSTLVSVSTELPPLAASASSKRPNSVSEGRLPTGMKKFEFCLSRFCGFALKFAFNRETRSCDQFWFPGCRTAETNDNLFDTSAECLEASRHCLKANLLESGAVPTSDRISNPAPPAALPPPPPPQPNPVPFPNQPQPTNNGGGALGSFNQAGQFIRMITNTIREVRERGGQHIAGAGAPPPQGATGEGGGGGLRWDANQLGGLLQSLGK